MVEKQQRGEKLVTHVVRIEHAYDHGFGDLSSDFEKAERTLRALDDSDDDTDMAMFDQFRDRGMTL